MQTVEPTLCPEQSSNDEDTTNATALERAETLLIG